jgi:hypothetical protein
MKAANNSIKNKQIVKNKMKTTPEKKIPLYFDLRYIINRIQEIRSCITKLRNYLNQEMITKWTNYQHVIELLKEKYEVITSTSSLTFQDINHFKLYLKELIDIRKQLRILFKLELNILE